MDDARALKRAYAALIRTYGPETHPEVFQHIRRLYEQAGVEREARAEVAAARAVRASPSAESAAGESAAASAVAAAAAAAAARAIAMDTCVAELDAADLAGGIEVLDARWRDGGDRDALMVAIALLEASDPGRVVSRLLECVREEPGVRRLVGRMAVAIAGRRPAVVESPDWRALIDACGGAGADTQLERVTIEALHVLGQPVAAWRAWEAIQAEVRRRDVEEWARGTTLLLGAAGQSLPEDVLDAWIERFGSAELDLTDRVSDSLCRLACDGIAFGRAAADPTVPPALLRTLRDAIEAKEGESMLILRTLGADPTWARQIDALAPRHPGIVSVALRFVAMLTRRDVALQAWRAHGKPPPLGVALPAADTTAVLDEGLRESEAIVDAARRAASANHQVVARKASWLVGAGFVLFLLALAGFDVHALLGLGLLVLSGLCVWRALHVSLLGGATRGLAAELAAAEDAARVAAEERMHAAVFEVCRTSGLWLHELAGVHADKRRFHRVFDELLADPLSDLRVIGDAHVRRVTARPDAGAPSFEGAA